MTITENSFTTLKTRLKIETVMGEAIAQVREITDHLQTLAVQADILSLKYDSESDRGRSLAWLLKKVKTLGIRAKSYM